MGRVVSPTPALLSSGRVVPALVASYDMHGRALGLFYTQPTGHILYDCLDEIIPILTSIMNKSLSSGIVPQCFNHALVKTASIDPSCLKHYRPVSNLLFLSKILERIVLKQFLQQLQSHSLLEPFQSAYQKCHITETALLHIVNDVLQASDSGCVSVLSLLDLLAAFDTIDQSILITRLR